MYSFIVACRDDRASEDDPPGDYTLATRRVFPDRAAAEEYARSIAPGREAVVVEGRWGELRIP